MYLCIVKLFCQRLHGWSVQEAMTCPKLLTVAPRNLSNRKNSSSCTRTSTDWNALAQTYLNALAQAYLKKGGSCWVEPVSWGTAQRRNKCLGWRKWGLWQIKPRALSGHSGYSDSTIPCGGRVPMETGPFVNQASWISMNPLQNLQFHVPVVYAECWQGCFWFHRAEFQPYSLYPPVPESSMFFFCRLLSTITEPTEGGACEPPSTEETSPPSLGTEESDPDKAEHGGIKKVCFKVSEEDQEDSGQDTMSYRDSYRLV